jgi:hypothetical protein
VTLLDDSIEREIKIHPGFVDKGSAFWVGA